jgi:hypothetical protein
MAAPETARYRSSNQHLTFAAHFRWIAPELLARPNTVPSIYWVPVR